MLLKRNNTTYCDGMYALPGGHLEIGESIVECMRRELIDKAKQNNINTIVTANTLLLNKENLEVLKKLI